MHEKAKYRMKSWAKRAGLFKYYIVISISSISILIVILKKWKCRKSQCWPNAMKQLYLDIDDIKDEIDSVPKFERRMMMMMMMMMRLLIGLCLSLIISHVMMISILGNIWTKRHQLIWRVTADLNWYFTKLTISQHFPEISGKLSVPALFKYIGYQISNYTMIIYGMESIFQCSIWVFICIINSDIFLYSPAIYQRFYSL